MKNTANKSLKSSQKLYERAVACGINAKVIDRSNPQTRRYSAVGSTASPQKVIILDEKRFSIGGAKQYIESRESTQY